MMSEKEYSYPLDLDWSTDEVVDVTEFFVAVEQAFEGDGVRRGELAERYQAFKRVVPGKAEEKTLFKEFKSRSGLESYDVVKQLKEVEDDQAIIRG